MEVTNIQASYETRLGPPIRAVNGVSFDLDHGDILGIVGESGCGKSTLAAVLSGNAPPSLRVRSGTLRMDDGQAIDISHKDKIPRAWRGTTVSLLPQRALNSLNPTSRIGDYVHDVMRAHTSRMSRREAIDRASDRLQQLGLPPRVLHNYPHELSGGMRQRVVTVIATLLNPTVLIADEPTSALDVSSQKALVLMLRQMMSEGMLSRTVFISHDLALLSNIANRIAVMYAGEIVEMGTAREIVTTPQHPYAKALIGSTLEPDPDQRGKTIQGLQGSSPDMRRLPLGCPFHPRCAYAMDICSRETPPRAGDGRHYAACWLVKDQPQSESMKAGGHERDQRLTPTS